MATEALAWSDNAASSQPASNPTREYSTDDKKRLISQQLGLLIHAHKCQTGTCHSKQCKIMKSVLEHLRSCALGSECQFKHCYSSRQIIMHWGNCKIANCQVCATYRDTSSHHHHQHNATCTLHPIKSKEEKKRLIQKNLVLLLHANMCEQRANVQCNSPHCKVMKELLRHMKLCREGDACKRAHCKTSKFIIAHWRRCKLRTCDVCSPIRQALRNLQLGFRFMGPALAA